MKASHRRSTFLAGASAIAFAAPRAAQAAPVTMLCDVLPFAPPTLEGLMVKPMGGPRPPISAEAAVVARKDCIAGKVAQLASAASPSAKVAVAISTKGASVQGRGSNAVAIAENQFGNAQSGALSGSVYAAYLQTFPSLGLRYDKLLDQATNCEMPALAGSVLECRSSSPIHVWAQIDQQWRKAGGDDESASAKSRSFTGLIGADAKVGGVSIIGLSIGYVASSVHDNRFGDKADARGIQLGAYGTFDPGPVYVKAMTGFGWYNGNGNRHVGLLAGIPGTSVADSVNGDPDIGMWTFGVHGGYRLAIGGSSVLTPHLDYDFVHARLKAFTESGLAGRTLIIKGASSNHSFLAGGVKWGTQMGNLVPEAALAYRYRFGSTRSRLHAAFLGDPSSAFDVVTASRKRGTFVAGLSVGGKIGPVDLRLGYEGAFNRDITSHSGNFKIVLPIGADSASLPPPLLPDDYAPMPPAAPGGRG